MNPSNDILAEIDALTADITSEVTAENESFVPSENVSTQNSEETLWREEMDIHVQTPLEALEGKVSLKKSIFQRISDSLIFTLKYFSTSALIFAVLMVVSNYSAYYKLVHSVIFAEEIERSKQSLIESVAAADLSEKENTASEIAKEEKETEKSIEKKHDINSYKNIKDKNINLWIEITPYENRIIIPKIGKNIPLLDIAQTQVSGNKELNDIFMKELQNGVIRYPGSAKPGDNGNSFIFGHSSNFPWMEGSYNDVFALLDKVVFDDEVIVYYGQEKHVYKIRTKNIIRPGDVSILKSDKTSEQKQITLMTCWPIGTTLNRLVLTGDLIRVEK